MEGDYLELRAENLCYRVGERQLLQNISLSVRSGEAIGLIDRLIYALSIGD